MPKLKIVETLSINERLITVELDKELSLVNGIYQVLREKIINLTLEPGLPLPEQELAKTFRASKTPVREALIRLQRDGLIETVAKSGSFVTEISLQRYLEACFMRLQLEISAAQLLAKKGLSLTALVKMKATLTEQKYAYKEHDFARLFDLDESFHRQIFEYADLPGVWESLDDSKCEQDRVRHLKCVNNVERGAEIINEHTSILDAIVARDSNAVEQALITHLGSLDQIIDNLSSDPEFLKFFES